jgi:hypothetical protein
LIAFGVLVYYTDFNYGPGPAERCAIKACQQRQAELYRTFFRVTGIKVVYSDGAKKNSEQYE